MVLDPITLGFGAYVAGNWIYGVMVAGTVVGAVGVNEARKSRIHRERMDREAASRRAEETKWVRPYSITKQSLADVHKFVKWFQDHIGEANHKVEGVEGWLKKPCCLPTSNRPFTYENTVLTLSHDRGVYSLTISAWREKYIHEFWEKISN